MTRDRSPERADLELETLLSQEPTPELTLELADHLERTEWPHRKMAGEMKAFFNQYQPK